MDDMVLQRYQLGFWVVNKDHIACVMCGVTNIDPLEGSFFPFARDKCASLKTAVKNV